MKAFFHSILTAALLFAVPAAVADELAKKDDENTADAE